MPESPSAERFVRELETYRSPEELEKRRRYFRTGEGQYERGDAFIGVRMGQVFALARAFIDMPPQETEKLFVNEVDEARAGAQSIMDKHDRSKKTLEGHGKELFDLCLRRTGRIKNWDLVDLGAPRVAGRYLSDKPRDVPYGLARSENMWERRTAIVATSYFIRQGDVADAFAIAEAQPDDLNLIHKAAEEGGCARPPRRTAKSCRASCRSSLG